MGFVPLPLVPLTAELRADIVYASQLEYGTRPLDTGRLRASLRPSFVIQSGGAEVQYVPPAPGPCHGCGANVTDQAGIDGPRRCAYCGSDR